MSPRCSRPSASSSIEQLFDEIPANLRLAALTGVPEAASEMEVGRLMTERARLDGRPLCFIGAGAYEHHIPAAVWAIATRGEFYSAYTPYQAEASQGTLQLLYEYQTMMASLTGMEVSNASLYDGASAMGGGVPDGGARQPQVALEADPRADHRASALPQNRGGRGRQSGAGLRGAALLHGGRAAFPPARSRATTARTSPRSSSSTPTSSAGWRMSMRSATGRTRATSWWLRW